MRKILTIMTVLVSLTCGLFVLSSCSGDENFVAGSYSCESNNVTDVRIDVTDRMIDIGKSEDDKIYVDFFESDKEYYDIAVTDGALSVRLVSEKVWTDYIGIKPDERFRKIVIRLPDDILSSLTVITTNEDVNIAPIVAADNICLDVNGGDISFDKMECNDIRLTVKNGDINGSVVGGRDEFAITCEIKKGESNLPENKEGGNKRLRVECNNGNVNIGFGQ